MIQVFYLSSINIPDVSINVEGSNAPKPIQKFEHVFSGVLLQNIRNAGFALPSAVQKYAMAAILAKRDIIAIAKTGMQSTYHCSIQSIEKEILFIINEEPARQKNNEKKLLFFLVVFLSDWFYRSSSFLPHHTFPIHRVLSLLVIIF